MPSTFSTNLKIELMATGENSGTWGTVTNTNLGTALEQAVVGYGNPNYSSDANLTITLTDSNAAQAARALVLNVTSSVSLTGTRELVVPTIQKQYIVQNNTTGSQSITVKTSAGTGVTIPNGKKMHVYVNGTDVVQMDDFALIFNVDNLTLDGNTLSSTNTNGNIVIAPNGTGDVQLDADTVRVGDSNANATITTNGTGDLILNTNAGTNSGSITIEDGVNGNIIIAPNGTGQVQITNAALDLTTIEVSNINAKDGTAAITIADSTGAVGISTAVTMSATTQNIALGTSQTTGTFTVGGAAQTGTQTFDQSTKTHTLNLGTGATESGLTKTINLGTGGVSTSTTTITIGSANGTSTTLNGTVTAATFNSTTIDTTNIEVTNIKAKDGTAALSIADSTGAVTVATAFAANGGVTLGDASGDALTINSSAVSTPNGLNFDSDTFVIDATNNRVGIGTNAPQGPLEVAATGATVNQFLTGGTGNNAVTGIFRIGSGLGRGASIQGFRGASSNIHSLDFYTYNSADVFGMRLDTSGNLGVGTNAPLGKVHSFSSSSGASPSSNGNQLVLESSGNAGLTIATGASSLGNIFFADSGDNADGYIQYDQSGRSLRFGTATAEKMRLDSSGNLGLGVTPSGWRTGFSTRAIQVGLVGSLSSLQASTTNNQTFVSSNTFLGASDWVYLYSDAASQYRQYAGQHNWFTAPSGTANTTTITNGVSYTIITSGNQTAFGAANNNVGTQFTATSSGTLSSGTVSQNISFTQAMTLDASGNLVVGDTSSSRRLKAKFDSNTVYSASSMETTSLLTYITNGSTTVGAYSGIHFNTGADGDAAIAGVRTAAGDMALTFGTRGTGSGNIIERARIDSSGNLGIGVTPSAWSGIGKTLQVNTGGSFSADTANAYFAANSYYNGTNWIYQTTNNATRYTMASNSHLWYTAPSGTAGNPITFTQAMTLDASGNLVVGNTSALGKLDIGLSGTARRLLVTYDDSLVTVKSAGSTANPEVLRLIGDVLQFNTGTVGSGTERARITSGGYFKASNDGTYNGSTSSYHELRQTSATAGDATLVLTATNASLTGDIVYARSSRAANTAFRFYVANANGTDQFYVRGDGAIYAQNTTVQSISDARLKENIRNASEGLDVITALRPVRYDWKPGYGNDRKDQLGFIAQEVESVFSEAVSEWKGKEGDETYKTVGPGALIPVLVKAIQEQQAMINELKAEVAALKGV